MTGQEMLASLRRRDWVRTYYVGRWWTREQWLDEACRRLCVDSHRRNP